MIETDKKLENNQCDLKLDISGMSCAACVAKVEKALENVAGVREVSVNFASEKAKVVFDPEKADIQDFIQAVEKAGYGASVQESHSSAKAEEQKEENIKKLRNKLIFGAVIGLTLMIGMLHDLGLSFIPHWLMNPWLQLALTTPVLFWVGSQFISGAWKSLKN